MGHHYIRGNGIRVTRQKDDSILLDILLNDTRIAWWESPAPIQPNDSLTLTNIGVNLQIGVTS